MKTDALRKKRVAVLMGGWSAEREVSLVSGRAVLAALERLGFPCRGIDAGRDVAARLAEDRPDVAFIALHGRGGEDGAVQGLLEVMAIPYTGSGVLASALAMNKKYSKWLFQARGVRTPRWELVVTGGEARTGGSVTGFPAVVKPVAEGSTIGVSIVPGPDRMAEALASAFRHGNEAIVEAYVPGRELTVGILGRRALPAVEILLDEGFYDYRAKYHSPGTRYLAPADTGPELAGELETLAREAFGALGCRGFARVDFRVDPDGVPWVLEVNTIPGMTDHSLLPKAAEAAGLSFEDMVEEIVREGVENR